VNVRHSSIESYRSSSKRRGGGKAIIEALERRAMLSAAYSNADVTGPWSIQGMNLAGSAIFDGNGNVTGGMFTKADGTTNVPSGTYAIAPDGVASILNTPPMIGGINSSKDVLAFSNIQLGSLAVGVNSSSGGFTDADLNGTWYEFDNGNSSGSATAPIVADGSTENNNDNSGHGTVMFDGAGGLTITHTTDDSGTVQTLTGTYTVSSSGAVVVEIPQQATNDNALSFTGAINNSRDFIAADATDLPAATATNNTVMMTLVQPSGVYSNADLMGTWAVCADGGSGTFTFTGAGLVNGSFTNTSGTTQLEAGIYSVSANGAVNVQLDGMSSTGAQTTDLTGSFNASRNVVSLDQPNSGANGVDDMAVLIGSNPSLNAAVSVQSTSASLAPGQAVRFTASVVPILRTGIVPTGSVTFMAGSTVLGVGVVQPDSTASFTTTSLPLGNDVVTASYGGDISFLTNTSAAVNILVAAPATVGGLDPTFGSMGVASHNVGITSTVGLVVQGDDKSVIAGIGGAEGSEVFAVTRYNADGSLDTTFGNNGVANTSFGGDDTASAVTLLGNGDILVAGTSTTIVNGQATGSQFALAEYTSAGVLDTSFGNGTGMALTSFSTIPGTLSNDVAHAVTVGPDGTIYVGGSSDAGGQGLDFAVAAYTPAGTLSTTFGTNGKVLLDFSEGADSIASLAMSPNGELVAAGSTGNPSNDATSVALAEFLPTGALDTTFGANGKIATNVRGIADAAFSIVIDSKGNIVAGGYSATGSASAGTLSADFLLLRYSPAGKLDDTFGTHGVVITSFNQPAAISSIVLDADGSIVASGKTVASLTNFDPDSIELAIARYTAKGQLDTTFNGTGQAIFPLSGASVSELPNHPVATSEQADLVRSASLRPFDATSDLMTAFMQLTQSDQGIIAVTSGGELLDVASSTGNTVEAAIVTMGLDLTASLMAALPPSVIGGAKGTVSVSVTEAGSAPAAGTFMIELIASSSENLTTTQTPVQSFAEKMSLKAGKAKTYRLKFAYPSSLPAGNYFLAANVTAMGERDLNPANNTSVSSTSTTIAQPFVRLKGAGLTAPTFNGAKPAVVSFIITNTGNEPATTASAVQYFASINGTLTGAISLATAPLSLGLKPNVSHVFKAKFSLPSTLPAGSYTLVALLDPANVFNDPNAGTNFVVSGNTFIAG
jgi:uncharacterized delta-60 repeat protein